MLLALNCKRISCSFETRGSINDSYFDFDNVIFKCFGIPLLSIVIKGRFIFAWRELLNSIFAFSAAVTILWRDIGSFDISVLFSLLNL